MSLPELLPCPLDDSAPRPLVLVVDDHPANVRLVIEALQPEMEVVFALNGERALERLQQPPPPEVLLLDLHMPGMDGHELCRRIKADERLREIPLIFLTGDQREDAEQAGLDLGAVDYLNKPISAPILKARVRTHVRLHRQNLLLNRLAHHDALTGVANRGSFDRALQRCVAQARRDTLPLGLLFLDLDHFKQRNDHYGHAAGDEALRLIGAYLLSQVRRPSDVVARYGGEEFVCILPDTTPAHARQMAELLRRGVAALPLSSEPLTVSIGGAMLEPEQDNPATALLAAADAALYRAKQEGRNRVCWAE
ncbi:MAG TPA: diguanylate cyclase [Nevskiaceae bacterium]|nr:diguanylate cyclase [Nevskiaceae bacterium]